MKDKVFDLAMFECCETLSQLPSLCLSEEVQQYLCINWAQIIIRFSDPLSDTHFPPTLVKPGGEFQDGPISQWCSQPVDTISHKNAIGHIVANTVGNYWW